MQFNSIAFLLFFVLFFFVYQGFRRCLRWQNVVLLAGSYIFYGWWDWRFLGLIALTSVTTWFSALMSRRGHVWLWTGANIALNIAILVVFKYMGFFGDGLRGLLSLMGWELDLFTAEVLLPVGVSFYTFQAISYSVDVARREIEPCRRLSDVALFLAFFPQLLAGPIERGRNLLPQISGRRRWDYDLAVEGLHETLWGFFKKVAIADRCGLIVDSSLANHDVGDMHLAAAVILFVVQIYCDFSGYCNIARGVAAMLGFRLSVNFRYPLFATSPVDFWRRWNITLTAWLRDYIYIPLGGSRHGAARTCCNIMIVFAVSGLWHGASLNFVIWGLLWGLLVVADHLTGRPKQRSGSIGAMGAMFFATALTFVFFRVESPRLAMGIIGRTWWIVGAISAAGVLATMLWKRLERRAAGAAIGIAVAATWWGTGLTTAFIVWSVLPASIVAMLAVEWANRRCDFALERFGEIRPVWRLAASWSLILIILLSHTAQQPFIYFQF